MASGSEVNRRLAARILDQLLPENPPEQMRLRLITGAHQELNPDVDAHGTEALLRRLLELDSGSTWVARAKLVYADGRDPVAAPFDVLGPAVNGYLDLVVLCMSTGPVSRAVFEGEDHVVLYEAVPTPRIWLEAGCVWRIRMTV